MCARDYGFKLGFPEDQGEEGMNDLTPLYLSPFIWQHVYRLKKQQKTNKHVHVVLQIVTYIHIFAYTHICKKNISISFYGCQSEMPLFRTAFLNGLVGPKRRLKSYSDWVAASSAVFFLSCSSSYYYYF